MLAWIERRHYTRLGSSRYPADSIGHVLTRSEQVDLVQFVKTKPSLLSGNFSADDKTVKVFALVPQKNEHSLVCTTTVSKEAQSFSDVTVQVNDIGSTTQIDSVSVGGADRPKMTLPPLWRNLNRPSAEVATTSIDSQSGVLENLSMSSDSKSKLKDSGHLNSDILGVD
jgi:hypothetical protein